MYYNSKFFGIFVIFVLAVYFSWEGILTMKNKVIRKIFGWRNEFIEGKFAVIIGILFLMLAVLSWTIFVLYFYCLSHDCS